jgi:hypothetical protein
MQEIKMKINKITVLILLFFLFSCSTGTEDDKKTDSLTGLWKEEMCNMGFKIESNQITEYDDVSTRRITFAGDIVNNPDLTAKNGLIIIRITNPGSSRATIGYYSASRWKNFTGNQVGQTFAKDAGSKPIFYVTIIEAQALTESSAELNNFCCDISNRL